MSSNDKQDQSTAAQLEDAMTKQLRQQRNPFLRPIFSVAAIGALFMIFGLVIQMIADAKKENAALPAVEEPENLHLTIHGECVCLSCTLDRSTQHHRAIRYRGDGNEEKTVLLLKHPDKDMNLNYFCGGPTPAIIEGDILVTNGLRILQAKAFKAFPEERK